MKHRFFGMLAAALLLPGCGGGEEQAAPAVDEGAAEARPIVTEAPDGDWTKVVNETAAGGYMMGDPDAPVKLIEYASFTCPHCARFHEAGYPELVEQYVKPGRVAFEFRNFVRDPADVAASLLARCAAPQAYFPIVSQLFADQENWFERFQQIGQDELQRINRLPPMEQAGRFAEAGGMIDFVKMRGIPEDRAQTCLADQGEMDELLNLYRVATQEHDIPGTPSFVINGERVENASTWPQLEPRIREALQ